MTTRHVLPPQEFPKASRPVALARWGEFLAPKDTSAYRRLRSQAVREHRTLKRLPSLKADRWDHTTFMQRALRDRFPAEVEAELDRGWQR
jgi:hypothetical protein